MTRITVANGTHRLFPAAGRAVAAARIGDLLVWIADAPAVWHERAQQRRVLAGADDRVLGDLGLGRAAAEMEWHKPFWRR